MPSPSSSDPDALDLERPWLGLASFEEKHAPLFFGREAEIDDIILRVETQPLTTFYGKPGLGKTSLLRAGLIPKLKSLNYGDEKTELTYEVAYLRLDYAENAPSPSRQLSERLTEGYQIPAAFRARVQQRMSEPDPPPDPSSDPASRLWFWAHDRTIAQQRIVVLIDQFEEIVTLGASKEGAEEDLKAALAIIVQGSLPVALQAWVRGGVLSEYFAPSQRRVRVILSLRHDYLYFLDLWRQQLPAIMDNRVELFPLRGLQAMDAAYRPGTLRCKKPEIEPILSGPTAEAVVRHLAHVAPEVSVRRIVAVPPLISVLCYQLNEERISKGQVQATLPAVTDASDQLIRGYYTARTASIPENLMEWLERNLIRDDGTRYFILQSDLLADQKLPQDLRDKAPEYLQTLKDRLILASQPEGHNDCRYELIHDLLVPIVSQNRTRREADAATERERLRKEKITRFALKARATARSERAARQAAHESEKHALEEAAKAAAAARKAEKATRAAHRWTLIAAIAAVIAVALCCQIILAQYRQKLDEAEISQKFHAKASVSAAKDHWEDAIAQYAYSLTHSPHGGWADAIAEYAYSLTHSPQDPAAVVELWYLCRHGKAALAMAPGQFIPVKGASGVYWSPDGRYMAVSRDNQICDLVDLHETDPDGDPKKGVYPIGPFMKGSLPTTEGVVPTTVTFSSDSKRLLFAGEYGDWSCYTLSPFKPEFQRAESMTAEPKSRLGGHPFSPDGRHLITKDAKGAFLLVNTADGSPVRSFIPDRTSLAPVSEASRAIWSPLGNRIAVNTGDGRFAVLDSTTGSTIFVSDSTSAARYYPSNFDRSGTHLLTTAKDPDRSSPGPGTLFSTDDSKTETPWDGEAGIEAAVTNDYPLVTLDISEDQDGDAKDDAPIYNANLEYSDTAGNLTPTPLYFSGAKSGCFSENGKLVLLWTTEHKLELFSVPDGEPRSALQEFETGQSNATLSPDGLLAARASSQAGVALWEMPPSTAFPPTVKPAPTFASLSPTSPDNQWTTTSTSDTNGDLFVTYKGPQPFTAQIHVGKSQKAGWLPGDSKSHTLVLIDEHRQAKTIDWEPPVEVDPEILEALIGLAGKSYDQTGAPTFIDFGNRRKWRSEMNELLDRKKNVPGPVAEWAPTLQWWVDGRK